MFTGQLQPPVWILQGFNSQLAWQIFNSEGYSYSAEEMSGSD